MAVTLRSPRSARSPGRAPARRRPGHGLSRVAPPGESLERGHVEEIQRARLLAATNRIACELGAGNVAVVHIVRRAGVSRRTFYELFTDCEDCLVATLEDALQHVRARLLPVWNTSGSWHERVREALVELLRFFEQEPLLAQLLVVESLAVSHRVLERRARVIADLVDALGEGRPRSHPATVAAQLSAEGAIGGVLAVLHSRISRRAGGSLMELAGPLVSMVVLPYCGPAAARRELERPVPPTTSTHASAGADADPIRAAGMRLTYRTVCVLGAIAEHPGSSNRRVGGLAGMTDQGQISKLLARLERLGMIVNEGEGQTRGEPNAWKLTSAGQRVTSSMSVEGRRRSNS